MEILDNMKEVCVIQWIWQNLFIQYVCIFSNMQFLLIASNWENHLFLTWEKKYCVNYRNYHGAKSKRWTAPLYELHSLSDFQQTRHSLFSFWNTNLMASEA